MNECTPLKLLTVGCLILHGSALAYVQNLAVSNISYQGYQPSSQSQGPTDPLSAWTTYFDPSHPFVTNFTSPDIICHIGATPGHAYATVQAGESIDLEWSPWPEGYVGPVVTYLANCNGECTNVDKTSLQFDKIDEAGLIRGGASPMWAVNELMNNNNTWRIAIPLNIAPGNYVLRHEVIALRNGSLPDMAQNFPQCFNLRVTGAGNDTLPQGTLGVNLYSPQDPGLILDNIGQVTNYIIPGPPLYPGVQQNALMSVQDINSTSTSTNQATVLALTTDVSTFYVTATAGSSLTLQSVSQYSSITCSPSTITVTVTELSTIILSPISVQSAMSSMSGGVSIQSVSSSTQSSPTSIISTNSVRTISTPDISRSSYSIASVTMTSNSLTFNISVSPSISSSTASSAPSGTTSSSMPAVTSPTNGISTRSTIVSVSTISGGTGSIASVSLTGTASTLITSSLYTSALNITGPTSSGSASIQSVTIASSASSLSRISISTSLPASLSIINTTIVQTVTTYMSSTQSGSLSVQSVTTTTNSVLSGSSSIQSITTTTILPVSTSPSPPVSSTISTTSNSGLSIASVGTTSLLTLSLISTTSASSSFSTTSLSSSLTTLLTTSSSPTLLTLQSASTTLTPSVNSAAITYVTVSNITLNPGPTTTNPIRKRRSVGYAPRRRSGGFFERDKDAE